MEFKYGYNYTKKLRKARLDGDWCDMMYEKRISAMFFIISLLSTNSNYVGSKLNCTYAANLPGSYMRYISNICWLEGTYIYPDNASLDDTSHSYSSKKAKYYPLIGIMIIIGFVAYLIPSILYRICAKRSGMNIQKILEAVMELEGKRIMSLPYNDQQKIKSEVCENFARNMNYYRKKTASTYKRFPSKFEALKILTRDQAFMVKIFLIKKALMIIMPILLMQYYHYSLDHFWSMGPDFIKRLYNRAKNHDHYRTSSNFPLYTLCDIQLKVQFAELRHTKYTFECIMTKNVYLDLFFTIIYFTIALSIIGSALNLVWWIRKLFLPSQIRTIITESMKFDTNKFKKHALLSLSEQEERRKVQDMLIKIESLIIPDLALCIYLIRRKSFYPDELTKMILTFLWLGRARGELDDNHDLLDIKRNSNAFAFHNATGPSSLSSGDTASQIYSEYEEKTYSDQDEFDKNI